MPHVATLASLDLTLTIAACLSLWGAGCAWLTLAFGVGRERWSLASTSNVVDLRHASPADLAQLWHAYQLGRLSSLDSASASAAPGESPRPRETTLPESDKVTVAQLRPSQECVTVRVGAAVRQASARAHGESGRRMLGSMRHDGAVCKTAQQKRAKLSRFSKLRRELASEELAIAHGMARALGCWHVTD